MYQLFFWRHWVETCSVTVWFSHQWFFILKNRLHKESPDLLGLWNESWIEITDIKSVFILPILFSFSITILLAKIIWKIFLTFTEFLKKYIIGFFNHDYLIAEFDSHWLKWVFSWFSDSCSYMYILSMFCCIRPVWSYDYSFHLIHITT